eukprot:scaffold42856_cov87-Phaeocystis_antarctica.AAC.1
MRSSSSSGNRSRLHGEMHAVTRWQAALSMHTAASTSSLGCCGKVSARVCSSPARRRSSAGVTSMVRCRDITRATRGSRRLVRSLRRRRNNFTRRQQLWKNSGLLYAQLARGTVEWTSERIIRANERLIEYLHRAGGRARGGPIHSGGCPLRVPPEVRAPGKDRRRTTLEHSCLVVCTPPSAAQSSRRSVVAYSQSQRRATTARTAITAAAPTRSAAGSAMRIEPISRRQAVALALTLPVLAPLKAFALLGIGESQPTVREVDTDKGFICQARLRDQDFAVVRYTGSFANGTVFDTRYTEQPLTFEL